MRNEIYIFSGLGVDERVFKKLNFGQYPVTYIKWIASGIRESMEGYADRLLEQIPADKPVLIGLSFGGMMALEVSKLIETSQIILIASAKTKNEIPFYYKWIGKLRIHRCIPERIFKMHNFLTDWIFGATSRQDKDMLKEILLDTDPVFLKWAIDKVLLWKNEMLPKNVVHIHGTKDRILPLKFVDCHKKVNGGGHFMTLNKNEEINFLLKWIL